jgi:hypothetical protein
VKLRALHLALQHFDLVPEHEQLDISLVLWAASRSEHAAQDQIEQGEQHGSPSGRGERMLPGRPDPESG